MSQTPTLWGLSMSPWTEKARWALDHHGIAYRYREHTPMLGEAALRFRSRRRTPGTRATVPMLIDGRDCLSDSDAIARHVEARGSGEPLFFSPQVEAIMAWEREVQEALHAARVLVTQAILDSPDAQIEVLPPLIPGPLRGPLRALAQSGVGFIARKYDAGHDRIAASLRTLGDFAERLRQQLDGRSYLLGDRFTWADVGSAMVVNGFAGGVPGRLRKLPANAQAWLRPELVEQFPGLIEWRDRIYAEHRPASARVR